MQTISGEDRYSRFTERPEDCPYCLRSHSHTRSKHEAALTRNDEASRAREELADSWYCKEHDC